MALANVTALGLPVGDLATWVGSVGIVLTLVVTLGQLARERSQLRKERKRAQAVSVSAWYAGTRKRGPLDPPLDQEGTDQASFFTISNRSDQPVYEVVATLAFIQGAAPRSGEDWMQVSAGPRLPFGRVYGAVGPGLWTMIVDPGWGVTAARPGCEIGFTDAAGRHWIRRAKGQLESIDTNAIDYYGLPRPVDYAVPEPLYPES